MRALDVFADANRQRRFLALNQVLAYGEFSRQRAVDALAWLNGELAGREFQLRAAEHRRRRVQGVEVAAEGDGFGATCRPPVPISTDAYSMADIVAQCAFVLGKGVGLRIPPELAELARWFAAVSTRPTARA